MSLLEELKRGNVLRPLDGALVQSLQRLDAGIDDRVLAAAGLASLAVTGGHAGLDLARPQLLTDAAIGWPQAEHWQQTLAASPWVASPAVLQAEAAAVPLVLEQGVLYLRRYREYERRLALRLQQLAAPMPPRPVQGIAALFAQLFPDAAGNDQAAAAELALQRNLVLVTGGPGTGKTTTIAKLLLLRIAQQREDGQAAPRIALAAPTGRAAERMRESLQYAAHGLAAAGVDADLLVQLPETSATLHRLLGTIPNASQFKHHAGNPLPFDIVVVDEASMVDLPMMCKLCEAVADGAQLILLGDPDQLPSVEAGDVLAAILQAAENPRTALQGCRVHLRRGWRQSEALQLAPLAEAVRSGDGSRALQHLRSGALANVQFHEDAFEPLQAYPQLLKHWQALAACKDPAEALQLASGLRLLTALRVGPQGAQALNARIEARLCGVRIGSAPAWYPGRLLMVCSNSPRLQLFNGDVGICLHDPQGVPLVWFAGEHGVRGLHPATLPAHESAFAMTVHKAQGSEFETVFLQLPERDNQILSREMLYTGITRARGALHLAASGAVIDAALARHTQRVSGLAARF